MPSESPPCLVTVGGAIESTGLAAESGADSESESACQAELTPSQHASAGELVTQTRVTVGPVLGPGQ